MADPAKVKQLVEAALKIEEETGVPAELVGCQCAQESGWLERAPGNNPFGIKEFDESKPAVEFRTHEVINGERKPCIQRFAKYESLADAFRAHADLIRTSPHYRPHFEQWRASEKTDKDFQKLFAGIAEKYATDPTYAEKLFNVMKGRTMRTALTAARQERA